MSNYTSEELRTITATILEQLGGNKFIVMTGSKNFGFGTSKEDCPQLSFHLARNKAKAQYCSITLTPDDLYVVKFTKLNKKTYSLDTVSEHTGIYCDQLQELFTRVTGLYTHL